ncbi:hypothetical protein [Paenibacillus harenae]|uniref:hypothetical protein n=1 Tax=Paenibacillus harenae TaxID=306543 RepID=UPI00042803A8|nr:hypothetical protein [Paenibacillus harenae]
MIELYVIEKKAEYERAELDRLERRGLLRRGFARPASGAQVVTQLIRLMQAIRIIP